MAKPFSLQTLLDLSQLRMDEAGRRLAKLLAGEQEAGERVLLLQQYRDEYLARFAAARQNGIDRDAMSNFQSFLIRLDQAVGQAQEIAAQSRQRTAAGQREWLDQRGQVQAFDKLSLRHQLREQVLEHRQEQKFQDEHAARGHRVDDGIGEE
ncbi:flagellar FliJ protein [mine drainage metagenome]|uniref:Flagellar FliJ protein n=1 Tax=mine drainage metagenome TaxID=410659 RepID=A0A1J5RC24_9ZZZZ